MKLQILIGLLFLNSVCFAQKNDAGQIIFERKTDWIKLINKAKYLSKEEKDRIAQTWKNDSETDNKQNMILTFGNNKSHYTYENQMQFSEDGRYSWKNDDFIINRDFEAGAYSEIQKVFGKNYIVEDSIKAQNWKILNELKEVAGYICMRASRYDSTKNQEITAWFSTDLPVSTGPERHFGLPGTILEINVDNDAINLVATKVTLNPKQELPALPKKIKGKKINQTVYNKLIKDYITQQEKMHEFAWGLRY